MATVHLIHGYIGSGKTTFARKLQAETGAARFTPDEVMTALHGDDPPADKFAEFRDTVMAGLDGEWQDLVRNGRDVILDYGFWTRESREEYARKAEAVGARAVLYEVACSEATARERVRARNSSLNGSLYIAENTYEVLKRGFEPLGREEKCVRVRTD
jgi:predicted kinase